MKKTLFNIVCITSLAASIAPGFGATLFDSNGFESPYYGLGSLTGQQGWSTDGTGSATVQSTTVQSGSQAIGLSGTASTWHYPALNYTPSAGEIVSISTGINRGSSVTAAKNFGFFLDAYNGSVARVARVGLGFNAGSLVLVATTLGGTGGTTAGNYILTTPTLSFDTWYDLKMDMNYGTQTFNVYLNDVLYGSNLPFLVSATDLADVDLMMSYTTGATDVGYFDNYKVTTVAVPEPGSLSIAALGGLALLAARKRSVTRK